jgi:hypothetical protein
MRGSILNIVPAGSRDFPGFQAMLISSRNNMRDSIAYGYLFVERRNRIHYCHFCTTVIEFLSAVAGAYVLHV